MIDLRIKGLPNTVCVNGSLFKIKTDFREWLKFGEIIKEKDLTILDLKFIFDEEIEDIVLIAFHKEFLKALIGFYSNPNTTPKSESGDGEEILDYIQDGEYIVASFMAEYRLDLTTVDNLHWHMFKALFLGLKDDSKIKQIMSFRSYKKSELKYDEQCARLKESWRLPRKSDNNEEIMREINEEFYNS